MSPGPVNTDKPMKIIQIVHSYPPFSAGGTEIYAQSLSNELCRRNQIMVVFSKPGENADDHSPGVHAGSKNSIIKSLQRKIPENFVSTYSRPETDTELLAVIKDFSPDLVHIHHLMHLSVSFMDALVANNIPVVFTLHDYWYLCPQCFLTKIDGSLCDGPQGGNNCLLCERADTSNYVPFARVVSSNGIVIFMLLLLKKIFSRSLRKGFVSFFRFFRNKSILSRGGFVETKNRLQQMVHLLNKADAIISPSKLTAERYAKEGIHNITILPHGIIGPEKRDIPADKYLHFNTRKIAFGYIGSIGQHKGVHIAIEAFNRISSEKAELLVYGKIDKNEEYGKQLLGMPRHPNVKFMGYIEHADIFRALQHIHALVIPSLCSENYPLVANEAFMAKTPVIASNVGGLNELVGDGVSGFIFPKGDVRKLSEIMSMLIEQPDLLDTLSKNTPPIKTIEQHAVEIERLYQRICTSKSVR